MSHTVTVLSSDSIRGSILKKILTHSGVKVRWFKSFYEAKEALGKQVPRVIIFDAKGLFSSEVGLLEKLRGHLPDTDVIVLAEASAIPTFEVQGCSRELCLPEPIDPELLLAKVKEIVLSPPVERIADKDTRKEAEKDTLTNFLKQFLKLE